MPKTASKRAQARKMARVARAHAVAPERPVVRRTPSAKRKSSKPRGFAAFVSNYPWATTIFSLVVVGAILLILHQQQALFFAPKPKATATPAVQATCDLKTHTCDKAPIMTIDKNATYTATIKTAKGDIVLQLDPKTAPIAVNNFVFLAQQKWYDGTYFWRVEVPGKPSPIDSSGTPSQLSLIQGGSVAKDGSDGSDIPGYSIKDDSPLPSDYTPGTISMANTSKPDSAGAQFFITIGDESSFFSKTYVTFGKVTSGMDVVKKITPQDKIDSITITVQTPATATPGNGTPSSTAPAATATATP
ncbi:MAG TPA: peptidylprolyl isomerase [Ktedonobacterales bacterium]|jgi:cyclophilin family peptidyl-prolyl cis-trans isomerase